MARLHIPTRPIAPLVIRFLERWLGTSIENVAPINRISYITAPVLLIHGDSDQYVLPCNLDALWINANPEKTERLLISKRHHLNLIYDPLYSQSVIEFLYNKLFNDHRKKP